MSLFNPRILDASICEVIFNLSETQKADVLLHALQLLPIEGYRTVVENAVKSLLKVSNWSSANVARALLLRAKERLAAGYDLHSILTVDPENQDAHIQSQHPCPEKPLGEPDCSPRFSTEVWREIALFLPRRDLKSLLFVPNALSRIASDLLFRDIDLHLTAAVEPSRAEGPLLEEEAKQNSDVWHNHRSADILTEILVDPHFAGQVRRLRIYVSSEGAMQLSAFQVGMLVNTLPKLVNLRGLHCYGNKELIEHVMQTVQTCRPRLQQLSLSVAGTAIDIELPVFKHLTKFAIFADGENSTTVYPFLAQCRDTLRSLFIQNFQWRFPSEAISVRRLTHLQFNGRFLSDAQAFSEIFANGHQLESLMLSGQLECAPSSLFRQYRTSLPFLRHFSFQITRLRRDIVDPDLCPAISEFVRERTQLQTYHLRVPLEPAQLIGFDASAWGILPALSNLSSLSISYPKDLPPALAGWLVPRSVRALTLDLLHVAAEDSITFMNQLRTGMPPLLRYIQISSIYRQFLPSIVEQGFPNVRVMRINGDIWTVTQSGVGGEVELEKWPHRRVKYHTPEWLELLGCSEANWKFGR